MKCSEIYLHNLVRLRISIFSYLIERIWVVYIVGLIATHIYLLFLGQKQVSEFYSYCTFERHTLHKLQVKQEWESWFILSDMCYYSSGKKNDTHPFKQSGFKTKHWHGVQILDAAFRIFWTRKYFLILNEFYL